MISIYAAQEGVLRPLPQDQLTDCPAEAVWIDLRDPSRPEEKLIESWIGIDLPTREDMQETEASSRLYQHNGATFLTAPLVYDADTSSPGTTPVSFILVGDRLVTIRYADPTPFRGFLARTNRQRSCPPSGFLVLLGLLETVIDRAADIQEQVGQALDTLSGQIFHEGPKSKSQRRSNDDLNSVLVRIGQRADLAGKVRESLASLDRLVSFIRRAREEKLDVDARRRLRTLERDVHSLVEQDGFLAQKVAFLLDATLGLINIQQNAIIKIVSVVAVVFTPPTMIASIYGMNFKYMPELEWQLGYPWALFLMFLSAVLPYLYFKWRGWL